MQAKQQLQPSRPRAKILLPSLGAEDALRLVGILQEVVDAIWYAHGQEMSEKLIASTEITDSALDAGLPDDNQDLPF